MPRERTAHRSGAGGDVEMGEIDEHRARRAEEYQTPHARGNGADGRK